MAPSMSSQRLNHLPKSPPQKVLGLMKQHSLTAILCYMILLYDIILYYRLSHVGRVAFHIMQLPQAAPRVVPPRAPKAVPQEPVIRRGQWVHNWAPGCHEDMHMDMPVGFSKSRLPPRLSILWSAMCPAGPVLKHAEPQPAPDLDASWLGQSWFGSW